MKILVTHVPAGSGHQRAAEAMALALYQLCPSVNVSLLDGSREITSGYRWCFTRGYIGLIRSAPFLWGLLYFLTDIRTLRRPVEMLFRLSNASSAAGLERFFIKAHPDVVIGTHFLPMEVAAFVKRTHRLPMRLICVITDYRPHALWLAEGIDTYAVGSPQAKEDLLSRGIPSDRIQVLGIPVDRKFYQKGDRTRIARNLGLDPALFTILIGSGGAGTGPVAAVVTALRKVKEPIQVIVVTGKNISLFRALESFRERSPYSMRVEGFIDNMDELMDVSDLLLTKPGGLTCAEALTKGIPVVLYNPIPGQESRNAKFLEEAGAAIVSKGIAAIPGLVAQLIHDRGRLEALKENMRKVSFTDPALNIAKLVVG